MTPPTGSAVNLADATFGDFGVDGSSLVVSAEANGWDFVMRVTYGTDVPGTATILVASPASDGLTASPGGVAVDPQGTVLTTLPYLPSGSSTAIHVPVGFNLFLDQGDSPQPYMPTLGLTPFPISTAAGSPSTAKTSSSWPSRPRRFTAVDPGSPISTRH